jgi:hypothetical protein
MTIGLQVGRLRNCGSIPGRSKRFYPLLSVQTGRGLPSASCLMGTGVCLLQVNWPDRESDLHPVPNIRMRGAIPPLPICHHDVALSRWDNFALPLLYRHFCLVKLKSEVIHVPKPLSVKECWRLTLQFHFIYASLFVSY